MAVHSTQSIYTRATNIEEAAPKAEKEATKGGKKSKGKDKE